MENKKRIYRVETSTGILSAHNSSKGAYKALEKYEKCAAEGIIGLTPETLLRVTRWNGTTWAAISDV